MELVRLEGRRAQPCIQSESLLEEEEEEEEECFPCLCFLCIFL